MAISMMESDAVKLKLSKLNPELQELFMKYLNQMYEQESDNMISFLGESRKDLNTKTNLPQITQEDEAKQINRSVVSRRRSQASRTSSRPNSTRPVSKTSSVSPINGEVENKLAVERYLRQKERQSSASRLSRSQTVLSACASPQVPPDTPDSGASFEETKKEASKEQVEFPSVPKLDITPRSPPPPQPSNESNKGHFLPSLTNNEKETKPLPVEPHTTLPDADSASDFDEEAEKEKLHQETQEVLRHMSHANARIENERDRQAERVRIMKERKREGKQTLQFMAQDIIEKAGDGEIVKQKDKERQEQKLREKLEEKKKKELSVDIIDEDVVQENTNDGEDTKKKKKKKKKAKDHESEDDEKKEKKKKKKKKEKDTEEHNDDEDHEKEKKKKKKKKDKKENADNE